MFSCEYCEILKGKNCNLQLLQRFLQRFIYSVLRFTLYGKVSTL